MINSLSKDIKSDLQLLNEGFKNRTATYKQFKHFIEFHSNLKELSRFDRAIFWVNFIQRANKLSYLFRCAQFFTEIFAPIFMVYITWGSVDIGGTLLLAQRLSLVPYLLHQIESLKIIYQIFYFHLCPYFSQMKYDYSL